MASYWSKRRKLINNVERNISIIINDQEEVSETFDNSGLERENISVNSESDETDDIFLSASNDRDPRDLLLEFTESKDVFVLADSDQEPEHDTEMISDEFEQQLAEWAVKCKVPHSSLAELLKILRIRIPDLPKDPRTLLGTDTSSEIPKNIQQLSGGSYYHFGIAKGIECNLKQNHTNYPFDRIKIQINVDGVPLFKSTNSQFWPIQGMIDLPEIRDPFLIGLYYGNSKPSNLDFLDNFVSEYKLLLETGFEYGDVSYPVEISAFVCDAPARSFLKSSKAHMAYSACERCTQVGEWNGKMTYPNLNAPLRTDASFNEMTDEDHHNGPTPLSQLQIGLVSQFVLDYMHLVCLGVMRQLLMLWIKGPHNCRQGSRVLSCISTKLLQLRNNVPIDFSRKPRSLNEVKRWKATEFRQFLLYTGQVVLLDILPDAMYKNFLLLSVAMKILVDSQMCQQYNDFARDLLVQFVRHFSDLYGKNMVVYNTHNLIHLADDAKLHGSLDNISAFPFENAMTSLLKNVRKPSKALEQVIRRWHEKIRNLSSQKQRKVGQAKLHKPHYSNNLPQGLIPDEQFGELQIEGMKITLGMRDSCITLQNDIGIAVNFVVIDKKIWIVYRKFRKRSSFFEYPIESEFLNIFKVWNLEKTLSYKTVDEFKYKNVILPHQQGFIVSPLTHTSV